MYAWRDPQSVRAASRPAVWHKPRRGKSDCLLWRGGRHKPPIRQAFYSPDVSAITGWLMLPVWDEADVLLEVSAPPAQMEPAEVTSPEDSSAGTRLGAVLGFRQSQPEPL